MPRTRRKPQRDLAKEQEVLNAEVNPTGVGEAPAVKAVLSPDFVHKTDSEALDIALALQQIIRGQASLMDNLDRFGDELSNLRERMDKYDKAAKAWEEDRQGFLDRVNDRAENLRIDDPQKKAQFQAKAIEQVRQEIANAQAERHVSDLQFAQFLETQPKETIVSPGKVVTVNKDGVIKSELMAETIRIRNRVWVLPPGQPVVVPKLVADEYRNRQIIQAEQEERKRLLSISENGASKESTTVAKEWEEISKRYNSPTDRLPSEG